MALAMLPPPMKVIFILKRDSGRQDSRQNSIWKQPRLDDTVANDSLYGEFILLCRWPKIAVPTRTIVAPSSIAASRSSDMPIDSVSSA